MQPASMFFRIGNVDLAKVDADIEANRKADAVINIRYASAAVMQGAAEILVYGTAVKLK